MEVWPVALRSEKNSLHVSELIGKRDRHLARARGLTFSISASKYTLIPLLSFTPKDSEPLGPWACVSREGALHEGWPQSCSDEHFLQGRDVWCP